MLREEKINNAVSAHDKAEMFHNELLEKLNLFLPEKVSKFTSEDQPWATSEIKEISRRKKREYLKRKKSPKWKKLSGLLEEKCEEAKSNYYINIVSDLKSSNPGQWFSKLKRMSSHDQMKNEKVNVEELMNFSDSEQAEIIAENFTKVSNQYKPLKTEDIDLELASNQKPIPVLEEHQVYEFLKNIKTNTATVKDDIPAKIIKEFACELAAPFTDVVYSSLLQGIFPTFGNLIW